MATRIVMIVLVAAAMVGVAMSACRFVPWRRHGWPQLSDQTFKAKPLSDARSYCDMCGMQLCTLAQLHEAYINGFRSPRKSVMFAMEGFAVNLNECSSRVGCYVWSTDPNGKTSGFITFRRLTNFASAWCCGKK
ncbi:uncharacterized protein [Asterias amurensis]|uniref:uncharacterized protein n=1 Tax=Asterias amurensis TaxID=7602 RepID=UPI003AB8B5F8